MLTVFSHIAACAPLLYVIENPGSNTAKTGNRRLAAQTFMKPLAEEYLSTFSHCQLVCDDDYDDCFSRNAIKKDTDCFSNAHKVPHGVCGEDFKLANGQNRKWECSCKIKTGKHKSLPQGSAARAAWPYEFYEDFVSSLLFLLSRRKNNLESLRAKCAEDANSIREAKRVHLETRI